jgi:hypothetical protein
MSIDSIPHVQMSLFSQTVVTFTLLVPLTAVSLRLLADSFVFSAQVQKR